MIFKNSGKFFNLNLKLFGLKPGLFWTEQKMKQN